MEDKIDELLSLTKENNLLLKKIESQLNDISMSSEKMDNHIDNIMNIYAGYKNPLEYIKDAFNKFKFLK